MFFLSGLKWPLVDHSAYFWYTFLCNADKAAVKKEQKKGAVKKRLQFINRTAVKKAMRNLYGNNLLNKRERKNESFINWYRAYGHSDG